MATEDPEAPPPRRRARREPPQRGNREPPRGGSREPPERGNREAPRGGSREPPERGNGQIRSAAAAARIAVREIAALTGRAPNNIVAIQRSEDGWCVAVEVVETHRIPDSADILAVYETELDGHGDLMSYRRTRRYLRGKVSEE